MSRYKLEGIVLKHINYLDQDRIYTILTREKGKIATRGRGVRKISSRRGGNLDTLNHVEIVVSEGKSGFKTLLEAKTLNSYKNLKSSLDNSVKGFYIAELVHRLLEEESKQEGILDLLIDSLNKLEVHLDNETSRVNKFEIKLLELLGYGLALDRCVISGKPYNSSWEKIYFNPISGGFISEGHGGGIEINKNTADLLYSLKQKKSINKELLEDLGAVSETDRLIKMYIKDIIEGDIKTYRVFG